jgi:hypothetical protein
MNDIVSIRKIRSCDADASLTNSFAGFAEGFWIANLAVGALGAGSTGKLFLRGGTRSV